MKNLINNQAAFKEGLNLREQVQQQLKNATQNSKSNITSNNNLKKAFNHVQQLDVNLNNFSNPGILHKMALASLFKFIELLLAKIKAEMQFHITYSKEICKLHYDSQPSNPQLKTIRMLLEFDCFTLLNKKENPSFLKIEPIIERFKLLVNNLEELLDYLKKENLSKQLTFFDEEECQKCLQKIISEQIFEKDSIRKLFQEFYRFNREHQGIEPDNQNVQKVFETLKLYLYGISLPTRYLEDYPLHNAVYASNLTLIRRLCAREKSPVFHSHIEQSDPAGITPLMLAVIMGKKDAVVILANHGADPKHRSYPYARTPLEEAIQKKHRIMIKTLLIAANHLKQNLWETNKLALMQMLKKIPDFSFEMGWECDSKIIPFVKRFAPSDTYKINKLGDCLRIDLSLLGWQKLKTIRGNSSIIFNGKGGEEGRLCIVDHTKRAIADLFTDMESIALENKVDELMKQEQVNSEIKAENVTFKPAKTWRGEIATQTIEGYHCTKYNAKGTFSLLFTKRNVLVEFDVAKFKDFQQYFEYVMEDPLWLFEESQGKSNQFFRSSGIGQKRSPLESMNIYMETYQEVFKGDKDGNDTTISLASKKELEKMSSQQKKLFKHYTKNIASSVYLCENFPLNLELLLPILDILSNVSPQISRLKDFLNRKNTMNRGSFPLKAYIPIFFSLNAVISLKNFKFE
jgi:hypothetical protein